MTHQKVRVWPLFVQIRNPCSSTLNVADSIPMEDSLTHEPNDFKSTYK